MIPPGGPAPDLDPYFVPEGQGGKDGKKGAPAGDEGIRREHLAAEGMFRVAGTIAMVLGALVFVLFAVPVSGMLHAAGEPGGVLLGEAWIWRRWVARMATVLTLSASAAAMGWGLRRRRRWARWALIALAAVPILALAAGLGLRALGGDPARQELADIMTMPCVGVIVFPASVAAWWATCSRRTRAVFGSDYEGLVARTPKSSPGPRTGLLAGLGLAWATFILYWTLLMAFLGALVACGVIRTT